MAEICRPIKFIHEKIYVLSKMPIQTINPNIADLVEPATDNVNASFISIVQEADQFIMNPKHMLKKKATRNPGFSQALKDTEL